MSKTVIIGQGSQLIQLIRELFSLEYTPNNLKILTIDGDFNLSCLEFIKYYNIDYWITDKSQVNFLLSSIIEQDNVDLVISFSNPFILSKDILLKGPKFINFHPGILPYYKGSLSTINSLINGEEFVGGTWHYINEGIDTGNIIKVFKIPTKNFNAFTLNHKIFSLGVFYLKDILESVNLGYKGYPQEKTGKFYYNKFPDVSTLESNLQQRILYFPPKFV